MLETQGRLQIVKTTYDYLYTLLIVLIEVSHLILNWQYHTAMHEVTSQEHVSFIRFSKETCKILERIMQDSR